MKRQTGIGRVGSWGWRGMEEGASIKNKKGTKQTSVFIQSSEHLASIRVESCALAAALLLLLPCPALQ